ncbi:MAG: hypothetical protein HOQ10_09525 [Frateuria sp.]|nr:hypothetical protein [Frateuria sp.]
MAVTIPAPMQAPEGLRQPFTSDDWLYELKFDGYRCGAGIDAGQVELRTKNGADCTSWFPEIVEALAGLPGTDVLDGEICVLRPDGTSDFNQLQERARHRHRGRTPRVTYCVFDLLVHAGKPVMGLPLLERKRLLREVLAPVLPVDETKAGTVLLVKDLPADERVFEAMVGAGLQIEGVMAKRRASTYQPGVRSPDWVKIKRPGWQEGRAWKN